jgi:hypothetical protein
MTSEEERLARLRRTLHSLATRVPKIILTPVDWTFPVLKNKAVSAMRPIMNLHLKHTYHCVSPLQDSVLLICCARYPISLVWS